MFFETDDLYAKKLTLEDAPRFHQICTQPYILKWMNDWDMELTEVQNLIHYFIRGYEVHDPEKCPFILGIWHKIDQKLIGICGFGPKDELNGDTEIAYFIDEAYSHKGYMTQTVSKAIQFFFKNFDKPHLCALVDENNTLSKKILLKHNFCWHQVNDPTGILKPHYRIFR